MALSQLAVFPLFTRWPLRTTQHVAYRVLSSTACQTATVLHDRAILKHQRQRLLSHQFSQKRNFHSFFKKPISLENQRANDGVEKHYELVYEGNSINYVKLGLGGVEVALGFTCLCFTALACGVPMANFDLIAKQEPIQIATFVVFNLLICIGIIKVCSLYPLRIYYSEIEDKFIVILIGLHPFGVRRMKVIPGQIKPKSPSKLAELTIPWANNIYSFTTRTMYLDPHSFKYPFYYNRMLGYVKPT